MNTHTGFTLLETLIYIALFSLIALGAFSSIAMIQQSSQRSRSEALLIEEGAFIGDRVQMLIERNGTADLPGTDSAIRVTNTSFLRSSVARNNPEHVNISFTLESVADPSLKPITIHRTAYVLP